MKLPRIRSILLVIFIFLLAIIFIAGIGALIMTVFYGVPVGDDYLAIKTFSNRHTWLHEAYYSLMHTGRYAQSLASSLAYGIFRDKIAIILPAIAISWCYALAFAYQQLWLKRWGIISPTLQVGIQSAAIVLLIVAAGRVVDPQGVWFMYQPFFFSSAIVTYTIGLLLYFTLFYFYIRGRGFLETNKRVALASFAFLTYVIGLFNETSPATFVGLSTLLVLSSFTSLSFFKAIRKYRPYFIILFISSLLALISMYLSPSSAARRQTTGSLENPDVINPIIDKLQITTTHFMFRPSDIALIALVSIAIYFALPTIRNLSRRFFESSFMLGLILIGASYLSLIASVSLLVLGYGPATAVLPRTLLIPQIFFVIGMVLSAFSSIGWLMKRLSHAHRLKVEVLILIVALIVSALIIPHYLTKTSGHWRGIENYNAKWVEQDALLRQAASKAPNDTIYLEDEGAGIGDGFSVQCTAPSSKYTIWLTDGMEAYYGIREICSETDLKRGAIEK